MHRVSKELKKHDFLTNQHKYFLCIFLKYIYYFSGVSQWARILNPQIWLAYQWLIAR